MIATKEQERATLQKIKSLIDALGEDSYIATAFEGCFEIAEENIEHDSACSMKQRWELAEKKSEHFRTMTIDRAAEIQKLEKEIEALEERCEVLDERYQKLTEEKEEAVEDAIDECREVRIETADDMELKQFKRIEYFNVDDFRFVTVTEKNGWATSYKLDDLIAFRIQ